MSFITHYWTKLRNPECNKVVRLIGDVFEAQSSRWGLKQDAENFLATVIENNGAHRCEGCVVWVDRPPEIFPHCEGHPSQAIGGHCFGCRKVLTQKDAVEFHRRQPKPPAVRYWQTPADNPRHKIRHAECMGIEFVGQPHQAFFARLNHHIARVETTAQSQVGRDVVMVTHANVYAQPPGQNGKAIGYTKMWPTQYKDEAFRWAAEKLRSLEKVVPVEDAKPVHLIEKRTADLKPGDVVHFGDLIDCVTKVTLPTPPCVVVEVEVIRTNRGNVKTKWNAGIDSVQLVREGT